MKYYKDYEFKEELNKIFPSKFTVVVNSGRGYSYNGITRDFKVKSYIKDKVYKEIKEIKSDRCVQVDKGGIEKFNSIGNLISLNTYEKEYEDFGAYRLYPYGYVVLDRDLNIVYESKYLGTIKHHVVRNEDAFLQMLYKYGPSSLAYIDIDMLQNPNFKDSLNTIFAKRIDSLIRKNCPIEKIEEETNQFKEATKYIEKTYNSIYANDMQK